MFRFQRILVPCDFSRYSDAAIKRASDLAMAAEAEIHLLHVVADPPLLGGRAEPEADRLRHAREQLDKQLDPHVVVQLCVQRAAVRGTPHREICRYAQQHDIDLIVMGTHGRTGFAHVAIGSVAERVVAAAPCPVLVIRHPDQEFDLLRQAAKLLREEFGASLPGEFGETRATLKGRLTRMLNISEQSAEFVVEKLRTEGNLVWDEQRPAEASQPPQGAWRISLLAGTEGEGVPVFQPKEENSPAIDLVMRAAALRATDIHIDAAGRGYSVRFRIDGRLQRYCGLDIEVATHLIQQFKTLARLDIADPFHPQEGRLRLPTELAELEVRLTTSPVAGGEAVALRLFDRDNVFRPLDRLGLSELSLAAIDGMTRRGEGLVLVTGPTGSGKTTTVYSMLESLSSGERNIVSIEDPVEFPAAFVRQMEVDERHGVTMTSGLRTLLRMDPDVVFLGEIRDAEAAEIAMRAASSGKYVFSTLHTRDVASTVTALRDLRVDTRSLAGNLTGIVSQRLVRRLCLQCRQPTGAVKDTERALFKQHGIEPPSQLFQAVGCLGCRGTGYRGRIGVFEVVMADEELRVAIAGGTAEHELRDRIRRTGTSGLTTDALNKACNGVTSLEEAIAMHSV
jgi:type II secretory ATPase GspE/PulE/Tfp pilus assembly ATPase PilB-like protein/nucleotide-binding universal stress UspA family protein